MTSKQVRQYAPPFSLRLTIEEREELKAQAGRMPLGLYIREQILNAPEPRKRRFRQPVKDEKALAMVLAELRHSRLPNNINQLAKACHTGSLPVTPDTEKALQQACSDIETIREKLMRALGFFNES